MWFTFSLVANIILLSLFLLPILKRKTKESRSAPLWRQEEHLEQVLNAIPDFILVKGPQSKVVWANRSFREFYGMSNEELTGLIDSHFSKPDLTAQYVKDDAYVFETGHVLNIDSEPVTGKSGAVRYFNTVKSPILDREGRVIMTVGISRDITDKKALQETIEIERLRMIAASKMSALGEMSSEIAHEINNPLAIIHSRAGQLKEIAGSSRLSAVIVAEIAQKIEVTALRISKIMKSLLAFSRNSDQDPYESVKVKSLIEDTLSLSQSKLRSHRVTVDVESISEDLKISCQPIQISQVILNLLNNGCDAIEALDERWIRIGATALDRMVVISVMDSGHGIPKEVREKMMSPFFTTKPAGRGTGIGLSVSKGIIEAHQGALQFDEHSKNTRFLVCLPMESSAELKSR